MGKKHANSREKRAAENTSKTAVSGGWRVLVADRVAKGVVGRIWRSFLEVGGVGILAGCGCPDIVAIGSGIGVPSYKLAVSRQPSAKIVDWW